MLVDSSYATQLSNIPQAVPTLDFIKRVMKALRYVDIQVSGTTLTCQVKTGDGENLAAITNVMIRLAATGVAVPPNPPVPPSISVSVGTFKAGTGSNILWIQSTNTGAFAFTVTGSGSILVELTPNQGVAMSASIS